MNDVFISVIITAYNRKEFLLDAIKSALKQTLPKDKYEIIVIKNFKDNLIDDFINENNIKSILMEGTISTPASTTFHNN
jgi:Glycosyl transferase family 2.